MSGRAIVLAVVIVLVIILIGVLVYKYAMHTTYPLSAFWFNLGTGPSAGGALAVVTGTPLPKSALGRRVKISIKSNGAGPPVSGYITSAFASYSGMIAALDSTGTQATLTPVPSQFTTSFSAGVPVTGTIAVYNR